MDEYISLGDWSLRCHRPQGEGPFPLALLLHGWTGDENSMWIFTSRFPKDWMWLAPRAQHETILGGYSWQANRTHTWPSIDDLSSSAEQLAALIQTGNFPEADFSRMSVVGFSQGAALGYTLALLQPKRVYKLAGLAGFMPDSVDGKLTGKPLNGMPVFVAHGTLDEIVPIQKGRQAVDVLESYGANVTYCEDTVGHKLSANCFRGLDTFLNDQNCR